MRHFLMMTGCAVLAGCAPAPRDVLLAGLDFNDPAVIARASNGLSQKERGALAIYALVHWPDAKAYCGRSMFKGDEQPRTVGEAIDKTLAFDNALAQKRDDELKPASRFEEKAKLKQRLVDEFDQLTLQRDMLGSANVPVAELARRERELDRQLAANRAARDELGAVPAFIADVAN